MSKMKLIIYMQVCLLHEPFQRFIQWDMAQVKIINYLIYCFGGVLQREMTDELAGGSSSPAEYRRWPELTSSLHHRDYRRTMGQTGRPGCQYLGSDFISSPLCTKARLFIAQSSHRPVQHILQSSCTISPQCCPQGRATLSIYSLCFHGRNKLDVMCTCKTSVRFQETYCC